MNTIPLAQTNDLRVLDYDGQRVFRNFTISRLGQPVYHEPQPPDDFGALHLDRKEAGMRETHDDVIRAKHLPRVGQSVRSRKYGTPWRVVEKKEVWLNTSDDPKTGACRVMPAIYLCYWRVQDGQQPGIGKMLGYAYSLHDNTFDANWELLN